MHNYELQTRNFFKEMCYHESRVRTSTIMTYRKMFAPSKSNFEIDLTLH